MRAIWRTIPLLAAVAALLPSSATARPHRPKCQVPHGWVIAAQDTQAVVISNVHTATATQPFVGQLRTCLRSNGRFHPLVSAIENGYASPLNHDPPQDVVFLGLAGRYVAYTGLWEPHAVPNEYRITYLRDLVAGRTVSGEFDLPGPPPPGSHWWCAYPESGGGTIEPTLSSTGVLAVIQKHCGRDPQPQVAFDLVEALGIRSSQITVLDGAPPGTLANLQLEACLAGCAPVGATFAWWTHDGVWRTARVG